MKNQNDKLHKSSSELSFLPSKTELMLMNAFEKKDYTTLEKFAEQSEENATELFKLVRFLQKTEHMFFPKENSPTLASHSLSTKLGTLVNNATQLSKKQIDIFLEVIGDSLNVFQDNLCISPAPLPALRSSRDAKVGRSYLLPFGEVTLFTNGPVLHISKKYKQLIIKRVDGSPLMKGVKQSLTNIEIKEDIILEIDQSSYKISFKKTG